MRLKHNGASSKITENTVEPFTCGNCEHNFQCYDSDKLLDHCRDIHGWFMCRNWLDGDGCEYQAKDEEDLEKHMKNHCDFRNGTKM